MKMNSKMIWLVLATSIAIGMSACSSNSSNTPAASLSMKVDFTAAKISAVDSVALTSAKALMRKIKFENEAEDDSSELKLGPFVVTLNLAGGLTEIATGDIPNGLYDKVKFEIHKMEDGDAIGDTSFLIGTEGCSFVITGTYNDTAFTYKSKKGVEIEMNVNPPIVISDSLKDANLTLVVNPSNWFKKNGVFLDPRNEQNRSDIDDNIKDSFKKAYKDNDHDGVENDDNDDAEDESGH
jgi:hypothetical protein